MRHYHSGDDEQDFFNFHPPAIARAFSRRKAFLYALICLLWLGFGILWRDPWKPDETILSAVIADMATGNLRLPPLLADEPYLQRPPLYLWLAALTARATGGWLPLHEGARLVNILLLAAGMAFIWLAQHRFYGARAAWLAVLLVVGAVGMMVRAHLLNFGVPAFFGMAATLWGASFLLENRRQAANVLRGGIAIAAAAVFLLLSVGLLPMLAATGAAAAWSVWQNRRRGAILVVFVLVFVAPIFLWRGLSAALSAVDFVGVAGKWHEASAARLLVALLELLRVAAWSLFPLLPLALCGVWMERRKITPFLNFAAVAAATPLLVFFLAGKNEEDFFLAVPPLAVLAARALQVMPGENARILDFFALFVAGLIVGGGMWLLWGGLFADVPVVTALMESSFPGFALPPVSWLGVAAAAALSVGWIFLIANFGRSNERAAVNWSCGVTVLWAVFNLLLVGYVDSGKSYLKPAAAIRAQLAGACLQSPADAHWRAQLDYAGVLMRAGEECRFYLSFTDADGAVLAGRRGGNAYYLHR